jgi:hypothetical protein
LLKGKEQKEKGKNFAIVNSDFLLT